MFVPIKFLMRQNLLSKFSDLSHFLDYPTFAIWISGILRDPTSVREETSKRILKALHQKRTSNHKDVQL